MVLRPIPFAVCVLLAIATNAAVAASERSPADKACASKDTAAAVACLERAVKGAEDSLEATIKAARAAIDGGALTGANLTKTKQLFDVSAAQWRAARDADCQAFELYDTAIGAGGAQARLSCLFNETIHRQSVLKRLFSSQ